MARRGAICTVILAATAAMAGETPTLRLRCCPDTYQVSYAEAQRGALEAQAARAKAREAGNREAPVVDVMIVYTPAAAAGAGGAAKLDANIDAHIQQANQLYIDNQISLRIRLVYKGGVEYQESGTPETDIARLLSGTDGFMDDVPPLRDEKGADLVCLLTENTASIGGVGYVSVVKGAGSPELGYTVVKRSRIVENNYTFVHELGHNLGCQHDLDLDGPDPVTGVPRLPGAFPYSYGWHFTAQGKAYDSIMSEFGGTRIARFSSPNLTYLGVTTGIAETADNARTINETAAIVAAYRPTTVPDDGSGGTGLVNSALDTDADQFPDELESALGSDAGDPASTPFSGSTATPQSLALSKLSVKLNFSKAGADSIKLSAVLPVPEGFSAAQQALVVDAGGAIASFTLDAKGAASSGNNKVRLRLKSSKGVVAAQDARLSASFAKGTFTTKFADEGLSPIVDAKAESKTVPVVVLFNAGIYSVQQNLVWTSKAGRSGAGKQP